MKTREQSDADQASLLRRPSLAARLTKEVPGTRRPVFDPSGRRTDTKAQVPRRSTPRTQEASAVLLAAMVRLLLVPRSGSSKPIGADAKGVEVRRSSRQESKASR